MLFKEFVFWTSLLVIFAAYAGYPLFLVFLDRYFPKPVRKGEHYPGVSVVIAAYNEEKHIEEKILNCLALDYPQDKLELLIGSDGSTDATESIVKKYVSPRLRLFASRRRMGKAAMLKKLVPLAKGELILFADARQKFDGNAARALARDFADPEVGCVSGELVLENAAGTGSGEGLGLYWRYEKFLRKLESNTGSMVGATGAIYAVRKALFTPPPDDLLLDDVFIPLSVVRQGYRAVFESAALAYDSASGTPREESGRKIRTLAGNWQLFARMPYMFNPFKYQVAARLFMHKFLRVVVPFFLVSLFAASAVLRATGFYGVFFSAQVSFYLLACAGIFLYRYKLRIVSLPYTFCRLNMDAVRGFYSFVANKQKVTWK
jgi:poly-beta-1,6-N-acetyl-D-glucosamine synthase